MKLLFWGATRSTRRSRCVWTGGLREEDMREALREESERACAGCRQCARRRDEVWDDFPAAASGEDEVND